MSLSHSIPSSVVEQDFLNPAISEETILEKFFEAKKIKRDRNWTNFGQNLHPENTVAVDITSEEDLQELIQLIYRLNQRKAKKAKSAEAKSDGASSQESKNDDALNDDFISVKAAAGGGGWEYLEQSDKEYRASFSRSETAVANVIVRMVGKNFEKIDANKEKMVATVGPNIQMKKFIDTLYHKYGIVPPTSTLMPYVTWIGASMINGINTGNEPSLSDLTLSMRICNFKGEMETLNADNEEDFEKIKQCQLGLYGIIVEMQVRCIPAKKMQCVSEPTNRYGLLQQIDDGLFTNSTADRVSVFIVPRYNKSNQNDPRAKNNVVIKKWTPKPLTTPDFGVTSHFGIVAEKFEVGLSEKVGIADLEEKHNDIVPVFMEAVIEAQIPKVPEVSVGPWPDQLLFLHAYPHNISNIDVLVRDTIAKAPEEEKVAQANQEEEKLIEPDWQEDERQVLNVKLDGRKARKALEYIFKTLDEYEARGLHPVGYGIFVRSICKAVKGTESSLAPTHHLPGEIVYSIDIVSNEKIKGSKEFMAEVTAHLTGPKFNGLLHWGKDIAKFLDVVKLYGKRFMNFMQVTKDFYLKRGGDFLRSMFFTQSYRQLFKTYLTAAKLYKLDFGIRWHGEPAISQAEKDRTSSRALTRAGLSLVSSSNTGSPGPSQVAPKEILNKEPPKQKFKFGCGPCGSGS